MAPWEPRRAGVTQGGTSMGTGPARAQGWGCGCLCLLEGSARPAPMGALASSLGSQPPARLSQHRVVLVPEPCGAAKPGTQEPSGPVLIEQGAGRQDAAQTRTSIPHVPCSWCGQHKGCPWDPRSTAPPAHGSLPPVPSPSPRHQAQPCAHTQTDGAAKAPPSAGPGAPCPGAAAPDLLPWLRTRQGRLARPRCPLREPNAPRQRRDVANSAGSHRRSLLPACPWGTG